MHWHTKSLLPGLRPDATQPLHLGVQVTGDDGIRARSGVVDATISASCAYATDTPRAVLYQSINTTTTCHLRQFTFAQVAACPSGPKDLV